MTTATLRLPGRIERLPQLRRIVRGGLAARGSMGAGLAAKAGGAAVDWWILDGRTCQRAYAAHNATTKAASYVNLALPGTGDATTTSAPNWNKTDGWIFDGVNQFLDSGVVPTAGQTMIMQFTHAASDSFCGAGELPDKRYYLCPNRNYLTGFHEYGFGSGSSYQQVSPRIFHGILAMTTTKGWLFKVNDATKSAANLPSTSLWIGAGNLPTGWGIDKYSEIRVQHWATWAVALTDAEIGILVDRLLVLGASEAPKLTAYVTVAGNDSTGVLDDPAHPYLTLNGALDALAVEQRGIIDIGAGTFGPITGDANPATTKLINNLVIRGAGQPTVKNDHTGLEGGTIIQGPLVIDRDNVELYDLGIDSGSAVCTALYGGTAQDALAFKNVGQISYSIKPPQMGIIAKRITAICKANDSAVHAALFENITGSVIEDITTCFGVHGIILKAINTTANRLRASGHLWNGLIVKSDTYALCHDVAITDVEINAVTAGDCGGVRFDQSNSGVPDLLDVTVTGITNTGTLYGVDYLGATSGSNYIRRCNVVSLTGSSTAVAKSGNVADCYVNGTPV